MVNRFVSENIFSISIKSRSNSGLNGTHIAHDTSQMKAATTFFNGKIFVSKFRRNVRGFLNGQNQFQ